MNQQPGRWAPTWVGLQRLGREGRIRGQVLPRAVFLFFLSLGCISPQSRLQLRGQLPVISLGACIVLGARNLKVV